MREPIASGAVVCEQHPRHPGCGQDEEQGRPGTLEALEHDEERHKNHDAAPAARDKNGHPSAVQTS